MHDSWRQCQLSSHAKRLSGLPSVYFRRLKWYGGGLSPPGTGAAIMYGEVVWAVPAQFAAPSVAEDVPLPG
jgi:hypothetical protein